MKIGMIFFVIAKVIDVEKTREGETRRMRKDLVECVQGSKWFPKI